MFVRRATSEDLEAIVELHQRSWHATYVGVLPAARIAEANQKFFVYRWRDAFSSADVTVLVTDDLSGVARVERFDETTALLTGLYVLPEAQSNGVGSALVATAINYAKDARYKSLRISVVRGNERALSFYEGRGFVRTGEIEHFAGQGWQAEQIVFSLTL